MLSSLNLPEKMTLHCAAALSHERTQHSLRSQWQGDEVPPELWNLGESSVHYLTFFPMNAFFFFLALSVRPTLKYEIYKILKSLKLCLVAL